MAVEGALPSLPLAPDIRVAVAEHEAQYGRSFGRHPGWNTIDFVQKRRFKALGVDLKFPLERSMTPKSSKRIGSNWVHLSLPQQVADLVSDLDAVKPRGRISIFLNEAEPQIYKHPLVTEAFIRAGRPEQGLKRHARRAFDRFLHDGPDQESDDELIRRYGDVVYDFQYAEKLTGHLGFSVKMVRKLP